MLTEELDKIEEKVDDELGEDVIEEVKKKIKDQSEALLASSLARDKKVSRDESGGNFEEDEEGGLEGENKDKEDEAEKNQLVMIQKIKRLRIRKREVIVLERRQEMIRVLGMNSTPE